MEFLTILGREIPLYGLLGVAGLLLGLAFGLWRCPRFGLTRDDGAYIYVFAALGGLLGAKLLYLLTVLPQFIADLSAGNTLAAKYLTGGLVYYGGVLGAVAGLALSVRWFKKDMPSAFAALTPGLPLMHVVGRVGCHLTGCCYGTITSSPLSVVYSHSAFAPNGVPLLPVQLIEAGAELLIFVFLLLFTRRKNRWAATVPAYLLIYAPVRFVLEFFRGDGVRGFLGPLSTSQVISLLCMAGSIIWLILLKKRASCAERSSPCSD